MAVDLTKFPFCSVCHKKVNPENAQECNGGLAHDKCVDKFKRANYKFFDQEPVAKYHKNKE